MFGYSVRNHARVPVMLVGYARIILEAHRGCPTLVCPVKRQAKVRIREHNRQFTAWTTAQHRGESA